MAERLADQARAVDLLVNNAGYALKGSFLRHDVTEEEANLDVLCRAVLVLSHAAGSAMRERGHGAIVNVSSVASFITAGTYSANKSYVTVFTEGLAAELRGSGVTATVLCPGFTHTEFHQRADVDMSSIPDFMWLESDRLVRDCLDDVAKGRVVSVPSPQYKAIVAALRVVPRSWSAAGPAASTAPRSNRARPTPQVCRVARPRGIPGSVSGDRRRSAGRAGRRPSRR